MGSYNVKQDTEKDGTQEERELGDGRRGIRGGETEKGIYLHGRHVTEFLNKPCMFAYE